MIMLDVLNSLCDGHYNCAGIYGISGAFQSVTANVQHSLHIELMILSRRTRLSWEIPFGVPDDGLGG